MAISEQTIDGLLFKEMVINGTINLKKNCQKINNLNVFPVPDGDTGTNMYMTMAEGIRHIYSLNENSIIEVSRVLANALIMNSKGNSGVILSQFFTGFSNKLILLKKNFINIEEFIQSLISGYQQAYSSIFSPVEGTILTVLRDSIEAVNNQKNFNNIEELLNKIIEYAKKSLAKTPELLPILKESNVVDSGAAGLIYFFEGMLLCFQDSNISLQDFSKDFMISQESEVLDNHNIDKISDIKCLEIPYCYCTELVVNLYNLKEFDLSQLRKKFVKFGNSLIAIVNNNLLKIHIHTNKPGLVLTNALKYGFLIKSKIDNMKEQNKNFLKKQNYYNNNKIFQKNYILIAVVPNETIFNIFKKDFKLDYIIIKNRKLIWDFFWNNLKAILHKLECYNVILLPNDPEILLKSDLITKSFDKFNISVMNTINIAQGYNALVSFDETLSYNENISNMSDNVKNNLVGKILFNQNYNLSENSSVELKAFVDSIFFKQHNDLEILIIALLKKMITKTTQLVTIFYDQKLEKHYSLIGLEKFLFNNYNDVEINKIINNDHLHYYLILVEN
ncbi:MAG: DAK2 domain-containing protein [Pigeon pea little leaf phytoplasma]|uniref:DAK2 domain-containing protein n=1 Tax=Candidatus Phytoplasma fabacearum TaxID=2982628 RepID=A0ABU8ZSN5_9MOLU|nr:DAK2 domain-containing protein ['Bituminaria bituminosa' little leaf phytoplasma]MDV3154013.1 DAK2 domain-containing protein [Pigeon pea little leaf phytoplasma]MDO7983483.1 DAK2 domain-containing protein ['Bituminaria bituminosa' little leaf phytoplasma]MDO8023890.1 DAK2 domain-containing protein ['Bituminaria bituminosa' little leaf phytoplasma]MDO8030499.1 DAK2 domain-containing protein ['Bituminaria bituminosa' little leaf phytoplasma]MDV3158487.1 DAK2 domain-containing protein [Pigeon 